LKRGSTFARLLTFQYEGVKNQANKINQNRKEKIQMRKTTEERIAEAQERKLQIENEVKKLQQQKKSEERKARTHRLCKRGGIVENLLPALATFTEEQFDIFAQKVLLSEITKRTVDRITASHAPPTTAPQSTADAPPDGGTAETQPAVAEQVEDLL
jgi:hypothetical protein